MARLLAVVLSHSTLDSTWKAELRLVSRHFRREVDAHLRSLHFNFRVPRDLDFGRFPQLRVITIVRAPVCDLDLRLGKTRTCQNPLSASVPQTPSVLIQHYGMDFNPRQICKSFVFPDDDCLGGPPSLCCPDGPAMHPLPAGCFRPGLLPSGTPTDSQCFHLCPLP